MSQKRYRAEDIVSKLREAEVLLSQNKTVSTSMSIQICR